MTQNSQRLPPPMRTVVIIILLLLFRYTSRCVLVEFPPPCLDMPMADYVQFTGLVNKSSSAIGKMIGLGKKFIETGISELDSYILPKLRSMLSTYGSIVPRVLPSYAF